MGAQCCTEGAKKYVERQLGSWLLKSNKVILREKGEKPEAYYEIGKQIGRGSFGCVYLAHSKKTGKQRVLKTVSLENMPTVEHVASFRREVQIQCDLDHSNIARIFAVFDDDLSMHIAMEACMGGELTDLLEDGMVLGESDARFVMENAMKAVYFMHEQGVVHRDIKLENFLLRSNLAQVPLTSNRVCLIDFGFAHRFQKPAQLRTKCGTPWYTAPEVIFTQAYNEKCDIWSCGVLLYLLLSGSPPFHGENTEAILRQANNGKLECNGPAWEDITAGAKFLIRCMCKNAVDKRFTARQVLDSFWMQKQDELGHDSIMRSVSMAQAKNLKSFALQSHFKRSCLNLIAYQLDRDDVEEIRTLFASLDKKGDGTLTFAEMQEGLVSSRHTFNIEELQKYFTMADISGCGSLSYTEFLASLIDVNDMNIDYAFKAAFDVIDEHNDGKIGIEDLTDFIVKETRNPRDVDKIMQEVMQDAGHDYSIDYGEFVDFMRSPVKGRAEGRQIASNHSSPALSSLKMKKHEARQHLSQASALLADK